VGVQADILIAGFSIAGSGSKRLLIRGVGPSLAAFGVPGVLDDPKLEIFNSNGVKIAESDNWEPGISAVFSTVGAFGLSANGKDAALVVNLDAGQSYTAQISGTNGSTGEALVEIYELP
jgi:hypothetical protein